MAMSQLHVLATHECLPREMAQTPHCAPACVLKLQRNKNLLQLQRKKEEAEYSAAAWRTKHSERQKCKVCSQRQRGFWKCARCGVARPQACFARHTRRRRGAKGNGKQTCDACAAEQDVQNIACRSKMRLGRARAKRKKKILAEVWRLVAAMRDKGAGAKEIHAEDYKSLAARSGRVFV